MTMEPSAAFPGQQPLAEQRAHRTRPGCRYWLGHSVYVTRSFLLKVRERLEGKKFMPPFFALSVNTMLVVG